MSLGDHLRELRRRVVISLVAIIIGAAVGWWQYDWIFEKLVAPIKEVAAERGAQIATVNFTGMTDAFSILITVGLFVGVVVASPVWLYQIWGFIVPGLTTREKRTAMLLHRRRGAAVPRRVRAGLPHAAQGGPRAAVVHPGGRDQHPARRHLPELRAEVHPRVRAGLPPAGVPRRAQRRRRAAVPRHAPGLAAGGVPHLPVRGDDDARRRTRGR